MGYPYTPMIGPNMSALASFWKRCQHHWRQRLWRERLLVVKKQDEQAIFWQIHISHQHGRLWSKAKSLTIILCSDIHWNISKKNIQYKFQHLTRTSDAFSQQKPMLFYFFLWDGVCDTNLPIYRVWFLKLVTESAACGFESPQRKGPTKTARLPYAIGFWT